MCSGGLLLVQGGAGWWRWGLMVALVALIRNVPLPRCRGLARQNYRLQKSRGRRFLPRRGSRVLPSTTWYTQKRLICFQFRQRFHEKTCKAPSAAGNSAPYVVRPDTHSVSRVDCRGPRGKERSALTVGGGRLVNPGPALAQETGGRGGGWAVYLGFGRSRSLPASCSCRPDAAPGASAGGKS